MGEIYQFPGLGKKAKENSNTSEISQKRRESSVELENAKYFLLMGTLSSLKKTNPEIFPEEEVELAREEVVEYDDFELIMKINNCTENAIKNNPCLYLAINYETWDRNLSAGRKKDVSSKVSDL